MIIESLMCLLFTSWIVSTLTKVESTSFYIQGNSIHATIYPPFIEKFRPLIKEGSVYNMTYFRVRASNNLYKPVPNDIMITFTNWTKLEQVIEIPPAFPTLTYSLTHIEQIHSRIDHKDYYTGKRCYLYTYDACFSLLILYILLVWKQMPLG